MDSASASYVVGVDLGQSRDPTAIAVVRRAARAGTEALDAFFGEDASLFQVGHLERLPLGTPYPAIVLHVKALLKRLPKGTELIIDFTGVGRPVFDLFRTSGLEPLGVQITGGNAETGAYPIWSVPKLNLVSGVQALLHEERLKIRRDLPEAQTLTNELRDFRVDFSATGHMQFSARSGAHDDIVLALAIAVWRAKSGGAAPLVTFMQAQAAQERRADKVPGGARGADEADRLPWHGSAARNQIIDGANELTQLYEDTVAGVSTATENVCDTCGKALGTTRHSDGVYRWHPSCPPPMA